MFRVGQKVVCIEPVNDLIRGHIYTVTATAGTCLGPYVGVDQSTYGPRASFFAKRFRPLVERKTDISIFTAMLTPSLEDMRELIREGAQ